MFDHLAIQVQDVAASSAFYEAALAPLGGKRSKEFGDFVGFGLGTSEHHSFWLVPTSEDGQAREVHLAFAAADRTAVDAFYAAAVAAGAESLHTPGLRPEYHASYYAAFVRDPDGNNIEAVCHTP
ncbi:VOC family protein [Streptomyces piniterrae]|uniref:VOC family protein n=1 Tax=Streptomyces piniterrae TaxID=2571125 RepID=A0A4U0NRC6_9ACTN|nr:VOC family protein [Streptomyces piniterrae]TJZ57139.1 VOC family protein [Streptomyces piniterrae]